MNYNKLGLVFSGGGGRGAYQIGVWKALREMGLEKDVRAIAGTSIGALNAALFLQGDVRAAEKVWRSVDPSQIFSPQPELERLAKQKRTRLLQLVQTAARTGLFSRDGLKELIDSHLDLERIAASSIKSWVTLRRLDHVESRRSRVQYLPLHGADPERIRSYLLASSAIPFVYGPETIDDVPYTDGGIGIPSDVTPIRPVYNDGCDLIVVVYSDRWRSIDAKRFENSRIVEITPREPLPILMGTFDFTPRGVRRRIRQGYEDGLQAMQSL